MGAAPGQDQCGQRHRHQCSCHCPHAALSHLHQASVARRLDHSLSQARHSFTPGGGMTMPGDDQHGVPDRPVDLGQPGGSARREYERRLHNDDKRRRRIFGRHLASVIKVVAGERPTTSAWDRGGQGEARVGRYLTEAVGHTGYVLHDRRIPRTQGNIDHIAVVPSGVWVIDTKQYRGRVQQHDLGGWFTSRPALFVNGRNQTKLIPGAQSQVNRVQTAVGDIEVHGCLCFNDAEWGLLAKPFLIDGITVTWPRRLAGSLIRPGPLGPRELNDLAARLSRAFPSYAPGGTSHKPTGA
jgi:Nuclease-related domain